jgi:hypothetical protein
MAGRSAWERGRNEDGSSCLGNKRKPLQRTPATAFQTRKKAPNKTQMCLARGFSYINIPFMVNAKFT